MLSDDKLKESITRRLNHSNGEIVKNFFVFHPSQFNINKKNGAVYAKPVETTVRIKNPIKFPAGFQHNNKPIE